jgi:hypothetical protein
VPLQRGRSGRRCRVGRRTLEAVKDAKRTTGLFYDEDGTEHTITSGADETSGRLDEFLRSSGKTAMPPVGPHPAATHVEAKTALMIREGEIVSGVVVVINHEEGPCPGAYSCQAVLGVVLPVGYALTVWWPGMNKQTFTGQEG